MESFVWHLITDKHSKGIQIKREQEQDETGFKSEEREKRQNEEGSGVWKSFGELVGKREDLMSGWKRAR